MENIKIIGPILAVALQVSIRFVTGRKVGNENFLELFIEIPMNIVFLSITFLLINLFSLEAIDHGVLILFVISIISSFIVILIYRECKNIIDIKETKKKILFFLLLILVNYIISLTSIFYASTSLVS
jgi:hypothetical protein